MKTLFIVTGIWVSLFAGTALVSRLLREPHSDNASGAKSATDLPDNARDKLESLPRRTQAELIELDGVEAIEEYPEFLSSFHTAVISEAGPSADRLRECKNKFMMRSHRVREFVEFSFETQTRDEVDTASRSRSTRLHEVLVERSSIELSEPEVTCLRSALEGLSVGNPHAPVGRMATAICFGHRL